MISEISMRDLQKSSAGTISALPHAIPIRNGRQTVGFLVPLRKAPADLVERVAQRMEEEQAARTPEQEAAIIEVLREIGGT